MSQVLISILTLGIGIIVAIVTVHLERIKDVKERYAERADVYKREHFKRLIEVIKKNKENQEKFLNDNGGQGYKGFSILETSGVSIANDEKKLSIGIIRKLIKDDELLRHLAAYKDANENIADLISDVKKQEDNYGKEVSETLNSMIKALEEIQDKITVVKFVESPYEFSGSYVDSTPYIAKYYIHNIIGYIIDGIDFNKENLDINEQHIQPKDEQDPILTYINGKLNNDQVEEFLNKCSEVGESYKAKLEGLKNKCIKINENYKHVYLQFNKIIQDFESGLPLEGTCEVCKRINKGKKQQTLMEYK